MVEVRYTAQIGYYNTSNNKHIDENSRLVGVANGVKTVTVPLPFLSYADFLPVIDGPAVVKDDVQRFSTSLVEWSHETVSSVIGGSIDIPVEVFIRAGEDFSFYQPSPPGFYNVLDAVAQTYIPPSSVIMETRCKELAPRDSFVPIVSIRQLMQIWSRCLPYEVYDQDDEPTPTISRALDPWWFPQQQAFAAHTENVNNSWFVTNDYISYLSTLFCYYKGSIGIKVLANIAGEVASRFVYIALGDMYSNLRPLVNNPYTYTNQQLPPDANPGIGAVFTPSGDQPILS